MGACSHFLSPETDPRLEEERKLRQSVFSSKAGRKQPPWNSLMGEGAHGEAPGLWGGRGAGFPVLTSWQRSRHLGIQAAEVAPHLERGLGPGASVLPGGRTQGRPQGRPEPLFWGHMGSSHRVTYLVCVLGAPCPASPFPVTRRARTCLGNSPRPRGSGRAGVAPCAQALSPLPLIIPHACPLSTCPSSFHLSITHPAVQPSSCFSMC